MKIVVQRVKNASLEVEKQPIAKIGAGLVVFVGFKEGDKEEKMDFLVNKICGLRVFEDEDGKMNNGIESFSGEILIVPNFTLYGNCTQGFRPSFIEAMHPMEAKKFFEKFVSKVKERIENRAKSGIFGADMKIVQENDGPVTLVLEN